MSFIKFDIKCFASIAFASLAFYNYKMYLKNGILVGNTIFRNNVRLANYKFYMCMAITAIFSYAFNFPKNDYGLMFGVYNNIAE